MVEATDIEKKSLEAHVELCAERYRYLEEKLDSLENRSIENNKMISVMFNWTIKTKCHVIDSLKCNSSPLQFLHKEIFIFLFYWKVEPTEALIQKKIRKLFCM